MSRRETCNKEIIEETAEQFGVTPSLVKEIVDFQAKFTKEVIESNSLDGVRYMYLGKIVAKPERVRRRNHFSRSKNNDK